jgi:hypothetical protein
MKQELIIASSFFTLLAFACSSTTQRGEPDPGTGGTSTGGSSGSGATGGSLIPEGGLAPNLDPNDACFSTKAQAIAKVRAIDIVAVIDDSTSMAPKWQAIKDNLSATFTALLENNKIDYRVIAMGENVVPQALVEEQYKDKYFQYQQLINSHDMFCRVLESYDSAPYGQPGMEPQGGWSEWLRPDTFKVFLTFTDENPDCGIYSDYDAPFQGEAVAVAFDDALLQLGPEHFGDHERRNYVWHSVVGLGGANQASGAPYLPTEPLVGELCADPIGGSGYNVGYAYQALSILTGGLRFPVCNVQAYDAMLEQIATKVVDVASVECEFPVPTPAGKDLDLETVIVLYTSGASGEKKVLYQVDGKGECADDRFYITNGEIRLCAAPCNEVQADNHPTLETLYGCNVTVK